MRSSRAVALAASLLVALAATARAQTSDDPPPPPPIVEDAPPGEDWPDPPPPEPEDVPQEEEQPEVVEPVVEPEGQNPWGNALIPEEPAPVREHRTQRNFIIGFEVGVGGVSDAPGNVYGAGLGGAIVLGYRIDRLGLEWHWGQSYSQTVNESALEGDKTTGEFELSSAGVRYSVLTKSPMVDVFGGVARASVPVLVAGDTVHTESVVGVGGIAGIGLGSRLYRLLTVSIEARACLMSWENPGSAYVQTTGKNPAGGVDFESVGDEIKGIPWTVTIGVRAPL